MGAREWRNGNFRTRRDFDGCKAGKEQWKAAVAKIAKRKAAANATGSTSVRGLLHAQQKTLDAFEKGFQRLHSQLKKRVEATMNKYNRKTSQRPMAQVAKLEAEQEAKLLRERKMRMKLKSQVDRMQGALQGGQGLLQAALKTPKGAKKSCSGGRC